MIERQPFLGKTRDADAWAICSRKWGYILAGTAAYSREDAIRKFNEDGSLVGCFDRYSKARRRGEWIARRLFTEARP